MEYDNFPILIPSKGRPSCPTAKLLPDYAKIIVEPQDMEEYAKVWGKKKLVVLPEDNKGITYVRNFTLDHARKKRMKWIWVMDDDITSFYQTKNGKNVITQFEKIREYVEPRLSKSKAFAQAALEYQQYAWSCGGKKSLNSYCDVCVAINTLAVKEKTIAYDEHVKLKEDRDFTLQVLSSGFNTVRFTKFSFAAPENGSNAGGLKDEYDQKSPERIAAFRMEEKWGKDICQVQVKKNGRVDAKVNWRAFKR